MHDERAPAVYDPIIRGNDRPCVYGAIEYTDGGEGGWGG